MYKTFIRPILDRLDSEFWHEVVRETLHFAEQTSFTLKLVEFTSCGGKKVIDKRLNVNLGGIELENPLLVGAGWDKKARTVKALIAMGFAGVEIGSVVEHRQPGNPKPRQFMLNSRVCLNWLGFNSPGMRKIGYNLKKYERSDIPIGVSLGINKFVKPDDAPKANAVVAEYLDEYASYFAINVSSPNTPGLRKLQNKKQLADVVQAVKEVTKKSVFVKISPDITDRAVDDVIDVALGGGITGIIATNTTDNANIRSKYGSKWKDSEGGLSGDDVDYRTLSTKKIQHIYKQAGDKLEIIGVGGIKDTNSALEKIGAGAKALQIVTGLRGEGPSVANKINYGLLKYMDAEGVKNISELVGERIAGSKLTG